MDLALNSLKGLICHQTQTKLLLKLLIITVLRDLEWNYEKFLNKYISVMFNSLYSLSMPDIFP